MSGILANQVAIVTGGGTGIGRAIVRRLAQEGAAVAVCGRHRQTLDRLR
uniref:SDR family NAD(P)-dependent oxidoreductase n=1 Tax=Desertifilum tharense IPPAS B-1220 TaxID=1781255 RepID=A0ACD5GSI8_9CYAN